jgi:hypothetical protein
MKENTTLQTLLNIELQRLQIATAFEKEKKIVFPETSMIIRDILRIEEKLKIKEVIPQETPKEPIKETVPIKTIIPSF